MSNVVDGIKIDGELKPLSNFVLVKVKKAESQTIGGIVIPDSVCCDGSSSGTAFSHVCTGEGETHGG
jgi:co-chaperonin GroES (HSP10)